MSKSTDDCAKPLVCAKYRSPTGVLHLSATNCGICGLTFTANKRQMAVDTNAVSESERAKARAILAQAHAELDEYFAGKRTVFEVPLDIVCGTPFQRSVWEALTTIPYGETRSYGEIAATVGRPRAARAVGSANNKNPIAIIVPCHRVVGSSGKLVGFAGGLDVKQALLDLEQIR